MANQHTKRPAPVADQNYAHLLPGGSNEELLARQLEAEAKRAESGYPKVEMGADAQDKKQDGFGDLEFDPLGLTDPMLALKKEYKQPGMELKLMSPAVMNRIGRRGYRIVQDENGDPVRFNNMVLGEIPTKYVEQRRQAVENETKRQMSAVADAQADAVAKLKRDAHNLGVEVLDTRGSMKDMDTGRDHDLGMVVERGELRNA